MVEDHLDDEQLADLKATAFHEAGHAVAALALGRNIQKVNITPGKSQLGNLRLGICEIKKGRSRASKDLLEDDVLILFAGMVAESRFTGEYCKIGAAQDLRAIAKRIQQRSQTERQFEKLHRRFLDKTEHLLDEDENVLAVELIAAELLEKLTISGRAARHFYNEAVAKCQ
jgi:ATP-dependent Zn protease